MASVALMETSPTTGSDAVLQVKDSNNGDGGDEDTPMSTLPVRIRVVVRIRPLLALERGHSSSYLVVDRSHQSLQVSVSGTGGSQAKSFQFDQVFEALASQEEVYADIGFPKMLESVLDGYHATVFAYGQTGSGKTYTMEGYEYEANAAVDDGGGSSRARVRPKAMLESSTSERIGIIPRAITQLFDLITQASQRHTNREFTVRCSFVQIYNEQILDLLNPSHLQPSASGSRRGGRQNAPGLRLRWTAAREFYVENLRVLECASPEQVLRLFREGVRHKVMASHRLNAASSRSHCLFTLYVERQDPTAADGFVTQSKLALVDLAGSERVAKTGASGVTLKESIGINKSLFVLRQVIQALSDDDDGQIPTTARKGANPVSYVPYRDSKLTSLLKDSLGGNSLTLMVACLSPSDAHADENLSTLMYAARAQRIATKPTKNTDPRAVLIQQLRGEVATLKQQLAQAHEVILSFQQQLPTRPDDMQRRLECGDSTKSIVQNQEQQPQPQPQPESAHEAQLKVESAPEDTACTQVEATSLRSSSNLVAKPPLRVTQNLKLKVIDSVTLVKQMYATEKRLSQEANEQATRIETLQRETRVLSVENQSLREKIEVLEYLLASQEPHSGGNQADEEDGATDIPGYGSLSRHVSSSSNPELFPMPPSTTRMQEVLRGMRTATEGTSSASGRRRRCGQPTPLHSTGARRPQAADKSSKQPRSRRQAKQAETGLLSFAELKDLLGGKKPSSKAQDRHTDVYSTVLSPRHQQQHEASGCEAPMATRQPSKAGSMPSTAPPGNAPAGVFSTSRETSTAPPGPHRSSALDLDPLDSLSELSRLMRVKAALRDDTR